MRFLLLFVILSLAACSQATKTYSYQPPETPGGRFCTNECSEAQDYCQQACDLTQRQCVERIQAQALQDYDKYTREQFASHQSIDLRPSDFERLEPCTIAKSGCYNSCEIHHQSCYESCGGKVNVTTSCQFLCF